MANGAALAPTVNFRAVVILQLVWVLQELSSFGLALTQRYLGPQLGRRHIVIINFLRWNQRAVLLMIRESTYMRFELAVASVVVVEFIILLSIHVHRFGLC